MISLEKFGDWKQTQRMLEGMADRMEQVVGRATRRNALLLEREIKMGLKRSNPAGAGKLKPLHEFTIQQKGSSKPLVETGEMLNSITHQMLGNWDAVVGLLRNAPHKGARRTAIGLVNLGWLHEHGYTVKVTPKMRAYLRTQGLTLADGTTALKVPARPFVRPVFESRDVQAAFVKNYKDAMDAIIGMTSFT